MAFGAEKSELIHFNKGRKQWPNVVSLALLGREGTSQVKPAELARFLRV